MTLLTLQMKFLNEIHISPDFDTDYRMTPEDFALFKNLPVKESNLAALDLTPENLIEFRHVMSQMEITYIG